MLPPKRVVPVPEKYPLRVPVRVLPKRTVTIKDRSEGWFLNGHCKCGCRFRTDYILVWCSGVDCNWVVSREEFDKLIWWDGTKFAWR